MVDLVWRRDVDNDGGMAGFTDDRQDRETDRALDGYSEGGGGTWEYVYARSVAP